MQRRLARQGLVGSLDAKVNNLTRSYGCEGIVNGRRVSDLGWTQSPAGREADLREHEIYRKEHRREKKELKRFSNLILPGI